ncbi:hypothetical protein [Streptomyces sedi]|uniref:hypothetical protein n=1 Tax=Streptomyces sedi TaxID=555059 RepID=UPI001FE9458F|nr:hypothetical protein [Streptomyces sedi]
MDSSPKEPRRGKLAQVRLQADEVEALQQAMRTLNLGSTSDALREGLHLLVREAAEAGAAAEIRSFYGGRPAPLPDGVLPPTEEELRAADEMTW